MAKNGSGLILRDGHPCGSVVAHKKLTMWSCEDVIAQLYVMIFPLCTISQHPYLLFLSFQITPITTDF